MTALKILAIMIGVPLCIGISLPVGTELEVQAAKRYLHDSKKVSDCIARFGKASEVAEKESQATLTWRFDLDIGAGDQILTWNREGIPYWAIYIVTEDGERIKGFAVDRFW